MESPNRLSEVVKGKLVFLMLLLHHVFFVQGTKGEDYARCDNITSAAAVFKLAMSDESFLTRAIVALGSGQTVEKILPDKGDSNIYHKSSFLAFWAATELMRRATSKRPGILQDFLANQLSIWRAPRSIVDLLCRLRISSSNQKIRLKEIDKVNSKIVQGWNMNEKKWSILMVAYDNLGFRILGAKCGYDQYTMIQVHEGKHDYLASLGFYLPPGSTKTPISRKRLDWAEERESVTKEEILPTTDDYEVFGLQIYAHIDALLQVCNLIPSVDEARELLESGDHFEVDTRLTTSYGARHRVAATEGERTVDVAQEEEDDAEEDVSMLDPCLTSTMYNRGDQNVEIDLPMRADLNKKETVLGIIKGTLDLRARALSADDDDASVVDTDERPIMEDLGIMMAGDGGPAYTFLCLAAANPNDVEHIHNYVGGFHWDLNVKQRHGLRFGDSHLKYFLHPFRDTDKKKDWYLNPGDPCQTALEQPEMTDSHYVMAMRGLSKVKGGEPISAVEVDEYMLERALEHDLCMTVLMDLRFAEIGFMLRDSETEGGTGNPELFRVGAQLSLLLFARTHATKYVRLAVDNWIWWRCSSEADRILYKEFSFTKKTVNGKPIWVDRFVEWMNKDVREYLGKYAKPNQELLLRQAAILLKDRKVVKTEFNHLFSRHTVDESKSEPEKKLAISVIFCHQMDLIDKLNLWSEGPVMVGKGNAFEEPQQFTDPSGENPLNTESLFHVSSAEAASMAYFELFNLQGERHIVSRSEREVSLRMTPVLLDEVKQARADEFTRRTSKDCFALARLATKAYLDSRLRQLLEEYPFLCGIIQCPTQSEKKGEFAKAMANAHTQIIAQNANFAAEVKAAMNAHYASCSGFADRRRKRDELQRPFYSLPLAAKQSFFERKYKINYIEDLETVDGQAEGEIPAPPSTPTQQQQPMDEDTPILERRFAAMDLFSP
jgi:hypothetical protein